MLHVCVARFSVMRNLEKFLVFGWLNKARENNKESHVETTWVHPKCEMGLMSRRPSYHLPHHCRLSMHLMAEIRDLNYSNPSLFVYWPSIVCSQAAAPSVSPPSSLFSPRSGATRNTREDACCLNNRRLPLPSRRARFRAAIPQSPPSPPARRL